jgi:hypothetical protein
MSGSFIHGHGLASVHVRWSSASQADVGPPPTALSVIANHPSSSFSLTRHDTTRHDTPPHHICPSVRPSALQPYCTYSLCCWTIPAPRAATDLPSSRTTAPHATHLDLYRHVSQRSTRERHLYRRRRRRMFLCVEVAPCKNGLELSYRAAQLLTITTSLPVMSMYLL